MRSRGAPPRSSGVWTVALLVGGLALAGTGSVLWAAGIWPFERAAADETHEGEIAMPVPIRAISAYQPVTRADITNPATGQINVLWLPKDVYKETMIRGLGDIMGRVLAKDKTAGNVFTETDFLPKGTRPGITGGIPPGKRAMSVPVSRIEGIELLYRGDAFDVLAVLSNKNTPAGTNVEYAALMGGIKPPDTRAGQLAQQTGVRVLVHAGVMVAMTQGQAQSTQGAAQLNGLVAAPANRRGPPVPSVNAMIAVDAEEVTPLAEALASDVRIYCVARSGHADAATESDPRDELLKGRVAVPATIRHIPAYSAITQDDLADAVTGKLNVYYFDPEQVQEGWEVDFRQLLGRVVSREIPAGHIFGEQDLLPTGTPPGLSAGAPAGTVVISVPATRVEGLSDLQPNERFQVFAKLPDAAQTQIPTTEWAAFMGGRLADETAVVEDEFRTGVRTLVRDGLLMAFDADTDSAAIAVAPREIKALIQSIQREEPLQAVVAPTIDQRNPPGAQGPRVKTHDRPSILPVAYEEAMTEKSFPVLTRPVKAHQPLRVEDFVDSTTGRLRQYIFPADEVGPDWQLDVKTLVGRVAVRDLPAGQVIRQSDLFEPGTRPGVVASIPSGRVGFPANSQQITGLGGLRRGDRVSLVVAQGLGNLGAAAERTSLSGGDLEQQQRRAVTLANLARVGPLSIDAILSELEEPHDQEVRQTWLRVIEEGGYATGPDGTLVPPRRITEPVTETYTVTVQNFVLALLPTDVPELQEAISVGAEIHALALSGAPSETTPDPNLLTNSSRLGAPLLREHIRGQDRTRDVWLTNPPQLRP